MIIGDDYQFIHLHKCGGSTVAFLLMNYFNGQRYGGIHNTGNINQQAIIGCIRHPLSWYVSLWAYGVEGKGQIYEEISKNNPEKLQQFYTSLDDYVAFQKWLEFLLEDKPYGLLTTRVRKLYCYPHTPKFFIKMENLEFEFKKTMKKIGYNPEYVDNILIPIKNNSNHLPFMQYYTLKHKKLVIDKDKQIILQFYG